MDDRQKMRASDADRQEIVERLRVAMDEGRLKMDEYLERMGQAYEAVTYGDLAVLYADLPDPGALAKPEVAPPAPSRPAPPPARPAPVQQSAVTQRGFIARMPIALKVLWTIWLTIVSVNIVVWVLVSLTTTQLVYPWPVWVAGPSGAILAAVTAGVSAIRQSRQPSPPRLPAGKG